MIPTSKIQLLTSVLAYIMASWPPLRHKNFKGGITIDHVNNTSVNNSNVVDYSP